MFNNFSFAQPLWLLLFIPIIALLWLLWRSRMEHNTLAGQGIIAEHLARVFSLQANKKASVLPIFFTLFAVSCVIIAIASPQVNLAGEEKLQSPLIIALDLSSSMETEQPSGFSHLQRSQLIIDQLLKQGFNRPVSLIAFAGSAHQVLPVSEQLKLLQLYLGYLEPSVMPEQGDALNQLLLEINRIKDIQDLGYDLLIVSDGFSVEKESFIKETTGHQVLLLALNDDASGQGKALNLEVLSGKYLDSSDNSLYQRLTDLAKNNHSNKPVLTNIGYWLLFPVLLLVLYFFRKGFSLRWLPMVVLAVNLTPHKAEAAFIDWWLTADQQGAYYFNQQDFKEAALRFENKQWKAAAYVNAKEYSKAAAIYEKEDDLTGLFNLAVTNSKGRNYHRAQQLFQLIVTIDPDNEDAQKNLNIMTALIKEIQDTSENQEDEDPPSDDNDSEDMMDDQLAADKEEIGKREVKVETLSVDELLGSEQKKQQWLRDISRDPKLFLGAKFQAEYNKNKQIMKEGILNE